MSKSTQSRITLALLFDLVDRAEWPTHTARDVKSSIRTVARLLGADVSEIECDPAALRRRLGMIQPEAIGMSRARWNNVRSLFGKALALAHPILPGRSKEPVLPEWQHLLAPLAENRRWVLTPLARFLSARALLPCQIDVASLLEYRDGILADRLRQNPEGTWDGLTWIWNACRDEYPDWPDVVIERVSRRKDYILAWEAFDPAFKADADAYGQRLGSLDLSDDGPLHPARPVTVKTRLYQIRAAGSALVLRGRDPMSISGIADLVTMEGFQEIMEFFLGRHDGKTSPQVAQMAGVLRDLARHWVKVDEATLARIRRVASRTAMPRQGMTSRNRERLRPLDDEETVAKFLNLPMRLREEVEKDKKVSRPRAVLAQIAAAISLLQAVPIRRKNLASLSLERNLTKRGKKLFLVYSEDETKNSEPIDFELPEETVSILVWYIKEHRPDLLRGPSDALFPGEGGKAKHPNTLGNQISDVVFRFLGLKFHTHLFRHAAGKIFLDAKPGQYEIVRRVLGHRSMATTTSIYAGAETRSAGQHFAEVINARRLELQHLAEVAVPKVGKKSVPDPASGRTKLQHSRKSPKDSKDMPGGRR